MKSSSVLSGADSTQLWPGLAGGPTGPGPNRAARAPDPDSDVVLKLAFGLFLVDMLLTVSRVLEILGLAGFGRIAYLGVTLHVATFAVVAVSGGARRVLVSRVGIYLVLFTGWMLMSTLLSSWKGGSVDTVLRQWSISLIVFLNCGSVLILRQCRKVSVVMIAGTAVIAGASYFLGTLKQQRLAFESGTLGNANEFAMLLVLGVPFFLVPLFSRDSSRAAKMATLALSALVMIAVIRSGSRSSFLALIAILMVLFWTRPLVGKLKLGLLTTILLLAFLAATPSAILFRYLTIFNRPATFNSPIIMTDLASEAEGSRRARERLLEQSLKLTMEHPVFGIGPGIFMVGEADLAKEEGRSAMWHVSHNSYTQVSSEMGIPGLLLYLAALWCTFRNVFWFRAHSGVDPTGAASAMGLALLLSLTGLCVNLVFSSNAYMSYLPALMGLSVVFRNSLRKEMDRLSPAWTAPQGPQMSAPMEPARPVSRKPSYRFLGRPRRLGA
jgi:O-antigen ligase